MSPGSRPKKVCCWAGLIIVFLRHSLAGAKEVTEVAWYKILTDRFVHRGERARVSRKLHGCSIYVGICKGKRITLYMCIPGNETQKGGLCTSMHVLVGFGCFPSLHLIPTFHPIPHADAGTDLPRCRPSAGPGRGTVPQPALSAGASDCTPPWTYDTLDFTRDLGYRMPRWAPHTGRAAPRAVPPLVFFWRVDAFVERSGHAALPTTGASHPWPGRRDSGVAQQYVMPNPVR